MIEKLEAYMKENGWNTKWNEKQGKCLPEAITNRYGNISDEWMEFIHNISCMISPDETTWFLCAEDFAREGEAAFRWNEWECISLESADGDTEWQNEIKDFWNYHLPIVMSVKDGYSYYAIAIKDGAVVYGTEPEFEECEIVAGSFVDFMEKIVKGELRL